MGLTFEDLDFLGVRLAELHDELVGRMPDKRFSLIGKTSTIADMDLESAFAAAARLHFGSCITILGEEAVTSGRAPAHVDGLTMMLDPIDGTRLFREGNLRYSCTFALCEHGRLFGGCIYLPHEGARYVALRNGELYRNGEKVAFLPRLPAPTVAIRERDFPDPQATLTNLEAAGLRTERLESTARRLAEVATGQLTGVAKYVGHMHGTARLWGIGAGLVACEAAGVAMWLDRRRRIIAVGEPLLTRSLIRSGVSDLSPAILDDLWRSLSDVGSPD